MAKTQREILIERLTKKGARRNKDRTTLEQISQEHDEIVVKIANLIYAGTSIERLRLNQQLRRLEQQLAKINLRYEAEPL